MGVVGLRDVFLLAPATSLHHTSQHYHTHTHSHHHDSSTLFSSPAQDLWQQNQNPIPNPNPGLYLKKPPDIFATTTSGGGITCQDCGNQAKKDCSHRRCRTCCKSRGFDCSTHVRSTWVPAVRRRERQGGLDSGTKKPRVSQTRAAAANSPSSTSNTRTRSLDTSSSHQDASFRENLPGHVRAPAVFKCVQVTSTDDDGGDEFAYQAMVKIGGHVFKGFLYDQGADENNNNNDAIPNISELHLGGRASTSATAVDMSGLLGDLESRKEDNMIIGNAI